VALMVPCCAVTKQVGVEDRGRLQLLGSTKDSRQNSEAGLYLWPGETMKVKPGVGWGVKA
jgi:hypothetical protein